MSRFNDKVAVVTGGSSGIGLATASRFIADGARVVITGRNQEALDAAVAKLGDRAKGVRGDVANLGDLDRLFAWVREQYGRVDVLFANAGIAPAGPVRCRDRGTFRHAVQHQRQRPLWLYKKMKRFQID